MKKFYRVCHSETLQGLWYSFDGQFTGLIHDKLSFCKNNGLIMEFDKDIVGYLSATESLEDLFKWFSKDDIKKLQEHNFFVHEFETEDYKFYDKFQHIIISQKNSKLVDRINIC